MQTPTENRPRPGYWPIEPSTTQKPGNRGGRQKYQSRSHVGADCPHPMNPCPRGAPGPIRRARAACAATAGFCARFAALGPVWGGWPRAGCSTSTMGRGARPPKPFNSPNNATGRRIRPIWKACSPICSHLACTPLGGPKNGTLPKKSTATGEQT